MTTPKNPTVAQAVARIMKAYSATHIYTVTGAPQDIVMHCQRDEGIRVVLGRSERSVLAMADAAARVSGRPSFGYVQFGPGAAYLPPVFAEAEWGHSPLVVVSGSVSTVTRHRYEYQELDQTPMMRTATKWAGELPAADRIADVMRTAIRHAVGGTPGPAYLAIPADVIQRPLEAAPKCYAEPAFAAVGTLRPAPPAADIERAVERLWMAERPVMLCGAGTMLAGAWEEIVALAEGLGIPVVTSMAGKGAIAETHPLAAGVAGRYSRKVANETLAGCDLCIAFGTRLGAMTTDVFKVPQPGTAIVHIDIEPSVLGTAYREAVSVQADAKLAAAALLDAATQAGLPGKPPRWQAWGDEVQAKVAAWRKNLGERARERMVDGRINPVAVMAALDGWLEPDHLVVADTGYMAAWTATLVELKQAGRSVLRAAGSLGWAFPAAFGAKLAAGDTHRVVSISGDGGVGYHLTELETALRLAVPVTSIVLNNASLAFEYHVQKYLHDFMCPEASEFTDIDFAAVARAFGAHGERVTDPDEIVPALRRAEDSGRPAVVEIITSREVPPPVSRYEAAGVRPL